MSAIFQLETVVAKKPIEPAAKPKTSKGRFELNAPQSFLDRAGKVAEGLGLSLAAYIRMVVTEDIKRRERE